MSHIEFVTPMNRCPVDIENMSAGRLPIQNKSREMLRRKCVDRLISVRGIYKLFYNCLVHKLTNYSLSSCSLTQQGKRYTTQLLHRKGFTPTRLPNLPQCIFVLYFSHGNTKSTQRLAHATPTARIQHWKPVSYSEDIFMLISFSNIRLCYTEGLYRNI